MASPWSLSSKWTILLATARVRLLPFFRPRLPIRFLPFRFFRPLPFLLLFFDRDLPPTTGDDDLTGTTWERFDVSANRSLVSILRSNSFKYIFRAKFACSRLIFWLIEWSAVCDRLLKKDVFIRTWTKNCVYVFNGNSLYRITIVFRRLRTFLC